MSTSESTLSSKLASLCQAQNSQRQYSLTQDTVLNEDDENLAVLDMRYNGFDIPTSMPSCTAITTSTTTLASTAVTCMSTITSSTVSMSNPHVSLLTQLSDADTSFDTADELEISEKSQKKRKRSESAHQFSLKASIEAVMAPLTAEILQSNRNLIASNNALSLKIDDHLRSYSVLTNDVTAVKQKVNDIEQQMREIDFQSIEKKLIDHDRDMIKLRSDLDNQTNALRYIYILIRNIPETEEDKLHDHVKTVISHVAPSVKKWFNPIRLGPKSSKGDRPIRVKMAAMEDRDLVIKNRGKAYGLKLLEKQPVITDWISDNDQNNHNILWKIGNSLRQKEGHWIHIPCTTPRVLLYKHKKFKDNKSVSPFRYTMDDYRKGRKLDRVPDFIYDQSQHLELANGDIVFASEKQWLSNHYSEAEFLVNGEKFDSVEKYIGIDRARRAGDKVAEKDILKMKTGLDIMRRMNAIRFPDGSTALLEDTYRAMHKAQHAKFLLPELKNKLLSTKGRIYEGTADLRFGIGISLKYNFPGIMNRSWWPDEAQNLAGKSLMEIREAVKT